MQAANIRYILDVWLKILYELCLTPAANHLSASDLMKQPNAISQKIAVPRVGINQA